MRPVERITRGAHLVGAVPTFDAEVLGARMRANGICPSWHYHLIDVEALAVGCSPPRRGPGEPPDRRLMRPRELRPLARRRGSPMTCPPRSASRSAKRTGTPPSATPGGHVRSTTR